MFCTPKYSRWVKLSTPLLILVAIGGWRYSQGSFGSSESESEVPSSRSRVVMSRAERAILDSINYLETSTSLKAEFSFETEVFNKTYSGHGEYVEKTNLDDRADWSLLPRLERTPFHLVARMNADASSVASAEKESSSSSGPNLPKLEITCDFYRKEWWRYNSTEERGLAQLDLQDLTNSLSHFSDEENACLAENGVTESCGMNGMPGLGGIAGTLKRLLSYYDFASDVENVLPSAAVSNRETSDETSAPNWQYVKVSGEVNDRFWERVLHNLGEGYDVVPDYIVENLPVRVEIFFNMVEETAFVDGKSERRRRPFPYRIIYYASTNGRDIRGKDDLRVLFSVDYHKVVRNDDSGINMDDFRFDLQQANFDHINSSYVRELSKPISEQ